MLNLQCKMTKYYYKNIKYYSYATKFKNIQK